MLKDFEKEVIQDHIKKARQNKYRQHKVKDQKSKNDVDIRLLQKRKRPKYDEDSEEEVRAKDNK